MRKTEFHIVWHGDIYRNLDTDIYRDVFKTNASIIDDIKVQIQNHTQQSVKMPLNMGIERCDADSDYSITSQELRFWVQPKLLYQNDIQKIIKRFTFYPALVLFSRNPQLANVPVVFNFQCVDEKISVDWRPLSNSELVLNTKLEQIWPARTGKLPAQIVNMFNNNLSDLFERQTGQFSNGPGRTYTRGLFGKRYYHCMYGNER